MPKLVDLGEGEEMPAPSQPKRADHPTTIEITWKNGNHIREAASLLLPPLQDHIKILLAAAPEICPEEVPEGQIIYIDDDPAPLQLFKNQVDSLIMPPTSDMTPMAQKAPQTPGRDQLSRMPERRKHSPSSFKEQCQQPEGTTSDQQLYIRITTSKQCQQPERTTSDQQLYIRITTSKQCQQPERTTSDQQLYIRNTASDQYRK